MPYGDGTGPMGNGIPGRRMGMCGMNNQFYRARIFKQEISKEQQVKILDAELAEIDIEKSVIEKKLKELKEIATP